MYFDGYEDFCLSETQITDGRWHNVSAVYDGSQVKIYVDGTLENTCNAGTLVSQDESSPLTIGTYRPNNSNYQFNGKIDNLTLWNSTLTQDEIQSYIFTDPIESESGLIAISLSLAAMLFYIWIRFEWQFSIGSIVALFHDVIITIGIFSILSLEINLSIIAAVLTIVGYSMNDTVVIYDRIRENLNKYTRLDISDISNLSINETLSRTIITSVTTLLALLSIYILGGEILRGFSFAMILGVLIGTYSSIFVAAPVLKFFKVSYKTLEKEEEKIVP